jgi:uncharacterized cupredoxin-like copper-binding protein
MRRSSQWRHGGGLLLGLLTAVALGSTACSGTGGAIRSGLPVLKVSERDFRIKAPREVRAGDVRLQATNEGPDTHELLVVRFAKGRLPLRSDALTVDEDALASVTATTIEGFERGQGREARIHLAPGRYVLFCNMAGHYLGGMHATVIVR